MKHLMRNGFTWCPVRNAAGQRPPHGFESTSDPRDAVCSECLRNAAEYGAAAAMRYAAVEAGATQDPELVRERDEAIRRLDRLSFELEARSAFFCQGCLKLAHLDERTVHAGTASWCERCVPTKVGG